MSKRNIYLLSQYLNNECTEPELIEVARLLTEPQNQDLLPELFEQASKKFQGNFDTSPAHQKIAWTKLNEEILYHEVLAKKKLKYSIWFRVAASIVILIGVGLTIKLSLTDVVEEVTVQMKTVRSEMGKRSKLTLPDGTIITMNSGTSITYPEKFDQQVRSVSLNGEAYFNVKENPNHPFVVDIKGLQTRVLGTTFNIRAYNYMDNIKVSLTSGKIAVQFPENSNELILKPGQEAIYNLKKGEYELDQFDREKVLGWQNHVLFFNEASENQVINILEHWYGVNIKTVNSTTNNWKNLTARFDNESLETVLISLGYTLDFTYEINDMEVKIIYK